MSCSSQTAFPALRTVTISYSELKDKSADLSMKIKEGFGPNGLGILSITEVPGFPSLRQNLLRVAPRLAGLPEQMKKELEDPHSRYNFGWSHGKEKLESGKPDLLKGSFYANPILDRPTTDASMIQRYPSYCGSNIWPDSALPELELAFKALGKLIFDVGLMVAYHCDRYGRFRWRSEVNVSPMQDESFWLHKTKRFLCSRGVGREKSSLSLRLEKKNSPFLPINSQVVFGEDEIAYQIGETTEILSGGYLCATPHCVRAPKGEEASGLERSTFALFMQPDWDETLHFPEEVHIHKELISSSGALTFGEYTEKLLDKYYHLKINCTQDGDSMSSWCGWHTDHGSLTGLTCAMFRRDAVEIPCPDSAAGLYIRTRTDQIVKVVFGEDEIAYQIGETTEILSGGYLCATPHCVRAPKGEEASGLERSTFALFMQPDWDETLHFPEEVHIHKELISSSGALTFGEYTEKLLDKYYHLKM
ncbi:hypothetical protein CJ030_MR0G003758 [Morella rubra]|uniref:Fe2OG dioxygenase domain-containing protein n=1 Tax=Morella rubra TaxID=262757 RepID=A0A6A1ULX1_9ROSI|nr:hypothetical protein CJ030_MR0G003758 [Morella rubra]